MNQDERIRIAVTLGDPAGIGPEVALKAVAHLKSDEFRIVLVGALDIAKRTIERFDIPLDIRAIASPADLRSVRSGIPLLNTGTSVTTAIAYGSASVAGATEATAAVDAATQMARTGYVNAIACAPTSKEAALLAGREHPGHVELIASAFRSTNYAMCFIGDEISMMLVTGHIPIADVAKKITISEILRKLHLASETFTGLHGRTPRIVVCGLDPHCGENGLLGRIDTDVVRGAVESARDAGITVDGPLAADAVFRPYIRTNYDIVLGMYHDQVKVAVAALDSDRFVAYLAGIPIVRTTTTHGAALDIAGRGVAEYANMRRVISEAGRIAALRTMAGDANRMLGYDVSRGGGCGGRGIERR